MQEVLFGRCGYILTIGALVMLCSSGWELADSPVAWAQSVSGVRSFDGGVGPLFNLVGPGNLYLDSQGTQGYLYTPGQNFESYSFRNPYDGPGLERGRDDLRPTTFNWSDSRCEPNRFSGGPARSTSTNHSCSGDSIHAPRRNPLANE